MQAGKCCYCEDLIPSGGRRQEIEHYWPKAHYGDKRNLWTNLLLACDRCNSKKGDCFPLDSLGQPLVIDPTSADVNPETEITFTTQANDGVEYRLIGRAVPTRGSARGAATIEVVGLSLNHRPRERRLHYERVLKPWLERYADASDLNDKSMMEALCREFEQLMAGGAKYAGFVRAFARQYKLHKLGVTVPGDMTT